MATTHPEFLAHCVELLEALGSVRPKRMFSGHGLYVDELFVALIIRDTLYLKTDDQTRGRFEAAGCQPFDYARRDGQRTVMAYWTAPQEAMESPALMLPWARLAMASALRAANGKRPKAARKAAAKPRHPDARPASARGKAGA